MPQQKFIKALNIINQKLLNKDINWIVIGSASLAMQSVDIEPRDIDILTDKDGAFEIAELLKEYETGPMRYKESELFRSYFGEFEIDGITFEVMGDLEVKFGDKWTDLSPQLDSVLLADAGNTKLPVASLHDSLEMYEGLGRDKDSVRIQKINEILSK